MAPSRARRRGTFGAFRRPFVTDPVFWIAALISIVIGVAVSGALVAFGGRAPDSLLSWGVAVLFFVVAGWLSFKLLAMGLNISRALDEAEVADERRAWSLEHKGRSAGATAGKGARVLMGRGRKDRGAPAAADPAPAPGPSPTPTPTPTPTTTTTGDDETPEVTVDKAARVLGSMVGRRLADRRKDEG